MNRAVAQRQGSRGGRVGGFRRRSRTASTALLAILGLVAVASGAGPAIAQPVPPLAPPPDADAPAATPGPMPSRVPVERAGEPALPTLFADGSVTDLEGRIVQSTRGRPGPVRLEVQGGDGGKPVEVLVAPDAVCDRLGLSLHTGEQVHLRGSHFAGKAPIFVASAVVVDGKAIALHNRAAPARSAAAARSPSPTATSR